MRINTTISDDEADMILELMRRSGIADYIRRSREGGAEMCDASLKDEGIYTLSMRHTVLGVARHYPSNNVWGTRLYGTSKQITGRTIETLRQRVYRYVVFDSDGYHSLKAALLSDAKKNAKDCYSAANKDVDELM